MEKIQLNLDIVCPKVILNSMHRYQPRVHLVRLKDGYSGNQITDLDNEDHRTYIFPQVCADPNSV